ncbi:hypothetical protein B0A48_02857 [Cryoendolithus antarcticus]|uniref:Glutaredoxin-like protein n=1 Tax=Cryoendolithus antarcticus TaxID=1507870 RepID=A0A1V8TLH4_9PEZI|nr:hypothetical protein B0A48_02857 [Cryoendolithus antarcticus]
MRPTIRLLSVDHARQWAVRLTFFTRPNCGLCNDAKDVMAKVWQRRPFEFTEVNVMKHPKWKALYEFDTPVLHIDKVRESSHAFETTTAAGKLMHRFTEDQLEAVMDQELIKEPDSYST